MPAVVAEGEEDQEHKRPNIETLSPRLDNLRSVERDILNLIGT